MVLECMTIKQDSKERQQPLDRVDELLHRPVMLEEVIAGLAIRPDGYYLDGTFGRGGHARAILAQLDERGRLFTVDRDPKAVAAAKAEFADDPRFVIEHAAISQLDQVAARHQLHEKLDGILFDLGVSSPQLDDASRGFSFMQEGPLDMRMDLTQSLDAKTWLAQAREEEIATVIKQYGEERFAKRIARKIVEQRVEQAIVTTKQLAELVKQAVPAWERHKHPATRTFLAIRIFINQELAEVEQGLVHALDLLKKGGRLVVISFHSLEDRIVKRFMRQKPLENEVWAKLPMMKEPLQGRMRVMSKAIKPSANEVHVNPRARSAILRIGEKIV